MKLFSFFLALTFFTLTINAQVVTKEKKKTVNPTTGDTVYTESTIITTSEDITPRNNMIVINPIKFILFYNISYFHKVSNNVALGGGFQIPTISGLGGIGINAELRFYPSAKTLRGLYFAPNISFNRVTSTDKSANVLFSIGELIGWQWFPGDDFAIGLGIGIDYYTSTKFDEYSAYPNINRIAPALRFDVGYAW